MVDAAFWLQLLAAVPAGVGGVLLGQRLLDWVRER